MNREIRAARRLAESAGLTVVELRKSGSNHLRMKVQRQDGECCIFFCPGTPSDNRGARNRLAEYRRFAAGNNNFKKH
jgi:hypothetical protein